MGECSFWYRPTRVVPDQRPLNGRCKRSLSLLVSSGTSCLNLFQPIQILVSTAASAWWGADMVICLERGADLHMAQPMPMPLTVSCFSKIQVGFTFLVLAHPDSPGQRAVKRGCVCLCVWARLVLVWVSILGRVYHLRV